MRAPLIPLSVCAILMLAACGSDESVSSSTDPALAPPVAVNVASAGSGRDAAGAAPMDAVAENASTDGDVSVGMLPAFGGYTFEIGESLPPLPTNSTGYHFPAGASVDAAEVARVASALGVTGEPQATAPDTGNLWRVGPDDGTAPALFVSNDGQLSWYYSYAWATASTTEACAVAEGGGSAGAAGEAVPASDGAGAVDATATTEAPVADQPIVIGECPTPEPPTGVPTADEAETRTREILTALGEDPATFEFETYADEWSASVTAYTNVDGVRWPSGIGFGFGAEGSLQWAGGTLAEPVATGPYPLIDLDGAIARLSEQNGMWWGYGEGDVLAADARGAEEPVAVDAATQPVPTEAGSVPPSDGSSVPPSDGGSVPPSDGSSTPPVPEPVVATLVDVRADLWWVWDTDNSVWLLPAYTFTDTEGNVFTVPAITDEYLIVAEPTVEPQPEPAPAEPVDPPSSDVVVVGPPSTDVLVDPPMDDGVVGKADPAVLDQFVGSSLKAFEELAAGYGFTTRVVRQDGVDLPVTADFSDTRANVAVEGDTVVEIISIG